MYELIRAYPDKNELEYKSQHGATTFALEPDVPITLNGEPCTIRDLKPGDRIELHRKVGAILKVLATRGAGAANAAAPKRSHHKQKPGAKAPAGESPASSLDAG